MPKNELGNNTFKTKLEKELGNAFCTAKIPIHLAHVTPAKSFRDSDFQCNGLLSYARKERENAINYANDIKHLIEGSESFDVSITKPGFLNFSISDELLIEEIETAFAKPFWTQNSSPKGTIFIDYGGPNVAKEMHVGHLRSALIGQALTSILRFAGYQVISDVHLGDWGLQMGMTIAQIKEEDLSDFDAEDLGKLYPKASKRSKEDPDFLVSARNCTTALQQKKKAETAIWEKMVSVSVAEIRRVYDRLGVSFNQWNGESNYQDSLAQIIKSALEEGIATHSDGALIIRLEDTSRPPIILQTSAGAVGYSGTDLAALSKRISDNSPDEVWYVVDKRQKLHFEQVFAAARRLGFVGSTKVEHVPFGTVNGQDGHPYKTRDGKVMRLRDLLDYMVEQAHTRLTEREDIKDVDAIAENIAISAVKYGELSHDREKNYVFDPDHFLAFEGNTGPYLLYTSVRVSRLIDRAAENGLFPDQVIDLGDGGREIILTLDQFNGSVQRSIGQRKPSILATHAYGLANAMNGFYQKNPVLAPNVNERFARSYLVILSVANSQLRKCLDLLGMRIPHQM